MKRIFIICLCFLSFFVANNSAAKTFKIGLTHTMSYFETEPFAKDFLNKIYQPLGFEVAVKYFPTAEGLVLLNKGLLDADFSRFASVAEGYSNVLKVPTPINRIKYYYFCLKKADCDENKVILVPETILKARKFCRDKELNCKIIRTDRTSVFNMLTKKRGATVISSMYSSICHADIKKIYRKEILEFSQEQYHYIHKKHQNLLASINLQLQKPETIKALAKIRQAVLAQAWDCNIKVIDIN